MNREQLLRYATVITLLSLSIAGAAAQTQPSKSPQKTQQTAKQQSTAAHASNLKQSEGQRVFEQNCARCHTPPDGFSPRISNTIALHMRVRASLSEHDMQELERFLNP
jgi:cytochrome c5